MANELVNRAPTLPGLVPNLEADRIADMFAAALITGEGEPALPRLPNKTERRALFDRQQELARAGRPISDAMADQEAAQRRVALLCNGWSQNRGTGVDASGLVATFIYDLRDMPLFAIMMACDDVVGGRVTFRDGRGVERTIDPAFPVSSAQLLGVAAKHAARVRGAESRIRKILTVSKVATPEMSPEARKAMAENFQRLGDHLRRGMPAEDASAKARAANDALKRNRDAIMKEYAAMGVDPIYSAPGVLLSPALARKTGAQPEPARGRHPNDPRAP